MNQFVVKDQLQLLFRILPIRQNHPGGSPEQADGQGGGGSRGEDQLEFGLFESCF